MSKCHPHKPASEDLPSSLSGTTQVSSYIRQGSLSGRKPAEVRLKAMRKSRVGRSKEAHWPKRTHPCCRSGTAPETSRTRMTGRCEPLEGAKQPTTNKPFINSTPYFEKIVMNHHFFWTISSLRHIPESKLKSCGSFLIVGRRGAERPASGYRGSGSSCFKTGGPRGTKGSERWRWYVGLFSWLAGRYGTIPLFSGGRKVRHGSDSCRWNLEFGRTGREWRERERERRT